MEGAIPGPEPTHYQQTPHLCVRPSLSSHGTRLTRPPVSVLYQDYPTNWPEYTPRDKIADWLELYVSMQDLVVWTETDLRERPVYDASAREWDVTLARKGASVKLRPAHIVLATGTLGSPLVPAFPGVERFRGQTLHTSQYKGGGAFAGQRAVVIGAGNSSIDVCQDLVLKGAASVTMVQRSRTCVAGRDYIGAILHSLYPADVPVDVSDFRGSAWPFGLLKKLSIAGEQQVWDAQAELYAKLRKGGLNLYMGPEGEGVYLMVVERGGGEPPYDVSRIDMVLNSPTQATVSIARVIFIPKDDSHGLTL